MSHTKVVVYRRDATGYHKCVPQGIYPANTTQFHLRYEVQKGKRTYKRLPDGTDYRSAMRAALQKELSFEEVPSLQAKRVVPKPVAISGLTPGNGVSHRVSREIRFQCRIRGKIWTF